MDIWKKIFKVLEYLAGVGVVFHIFKFIYRAIRIGGDIDFVITRNGDLVRFIKTIMSSDVYISLLFAFFFILLIFISRKGGLSVIKETTHNNARNKMLSVTEERASEMLKNLSKAKRPQPQNIEIEFKDSDEFIERKMVKRNGRESLWYTYRFRLHNSSSIPIKDVKVQIDNIVYEDNEEVFEFGGKIPHLLSFSNLGKKPVTINPGEKVLVDMWSFNSETMFHQLVYVGGLADELGVHTQVPLIANIKITSPDLQSPATYRFEFGLIITEGKVKESMSILSGITLKKSKIKIDYIENDSKYFHKIRYGNLHRISIENLSGKTMEDVSIELSEMNPLHPVFKTQIPLPLIKPMNLNPGKGFVPIVQWNWVAGSQSEYYEIITEDSTLDTKFTVEDNGHEIELTFRGRTIQPISKRFKFGMKRIHGLTDKFWFKAIN